MKKHPIGVSGVAQKHASGSSALALRLFSERGVVGTTIEDITNAADVGKGTFFNYFPSKEHILAHLCQLQMGKIQEFVSQAIGSPKSMDRLLYELASIVTEEFVRGPALVRSILAPIVF